MVPEWSLPRACLEPEHYSLLTTTTLGDEEKHAPRRRSACTDVLRRISTELESPQLMLHAPMRSWRQSDSHTSVEELVPPIERQPDDGPPTPRARCRAPCVGLFGPKSDNREMRVLRVACPVVRPRDSRHATGAVT